MLLENIWKRPVGNVQMNISISNIFPNMLLDNRFHQNYQAVLAALSINGLNKELLLQLVSLISDSGLHYLFIGTQP